MKHDIKYSVVSILFFTLLRNTIMFNAVMCFPCPAIALEMTKRITKTILFKCRVCCC